MSFAMPPVWVALLVFFVFLIIATKVHERQPKKGKKLRNQEKAQKLREQAEARSGQSQNSTSKMEEQGDEMSQQIKDDDMSRETVTAPSQQCEKRDQQFNHQSRTKRQRQLVIAKPNQQHEAKSRRHQLEIATIVCFIASIFIEEIANLKEEISELKQDRKAQDEQRVHKLDQVSKAKEASSEQVQPGAEDQTGLSAIHASKPVAPEGEQPRIRSDTLGMEQEVPSSESETTTSKMLVAARTKPNNSEDENKSVEEGLKKPHQPFSRKSSFSSEASVPLDDISGVVAEGLQPLSDVKDATITTQIDKEINKKPTGIDSKVTLERALELRQLVIDAAPVIKKWDLEIEPYLQRDEAALRGLLSKFIPFSILLRVLCIIVVDKPIHSDIDNDEWLQRHHLSKFKQESGRNWLKENLEPRKAEERLNILEKAATDLLENAGRSLVSLYILCARMNDLVHPKVDLEKMSSDSKDGAYGEYGEAVQLLAKLFLCYDQQEHMSEEV